MPSSCKRELDMVPPAALLVVLGLAVHPSGTPCACTGSPGPRQRLTMRVRDAGFLRGDARAPGTPPCSSWPHGEDRTVEDCRTQLRLRGGAAAGEKRSGLVRNGAVRGGRKGAGRVLTRKERRQKAAKAEERTVSVCVAYIQFLARRLGPRYRQLLLPEVSARRRQSCFQVQRARECAFSSGVDGAAPRACLCVSVRLSKRWIQKHAWHHP
jgi:hypothetical protein